MTLPAKETEMGVTATERPGASSDIDAGLAADLERMARRGSRDRMQILVLRALVIVGLLGAWQLFSGPPGEPGTLIDEFYISEPTAMWQSAQTWVEQGILIPNLLTTIQVTLLGFAIGASLGMLVGFLLGTSPKLSAVFSPVVAAIYAIPRLALIPLFLLWFGLGIGSKLALVTTVVFFLVFYNTHSGVRDVDHELVNVLRVMKASRWHIHTKVTVPSAMNWIIAGLRVSVPYALVGAVTGEMTASNSGMGYLIIRASGQFDTAAVFAGIFILMVLALILGAVVNFLERRLLSWKADRLGTA
jgi:NitT/TauT family transport system permease protein